MAKKSNSENEQSKSKRLNLSLDSETYDYISTIGSARFGSMTAYIEVLVKRDREAWKENEEQLREILKRWPGYKKSFQSRKSDKFNLLFVTIQTQ